MEARASRNRDRDSSASTAMAEPSDDTRMLIATAAGS